MSSHEDIVSRLLSFVQTTGIQIEVELGSNVFFRTVERSWSDGSVARCSREWMGRIDGGSVGTSGVESSGISKPESTMAFADNKILVRGICQGRDGVRRLCQEPVVGVQVAQGGECVDGVGKDDTFIDQLYCDQRSCGNGACDVTVGSEFVSIQSDVFVEKTKKEKKTQENRQKRAKAKERKARKKAAVFQSQFVGGDGVSEVPEWRRSACPGSGRRWEKPGQMVARIINESDVEGELKESVKRKWIARNKLQAIEAERRIAVLGANPVDGESKRYRTKVQAGIERNMVSIEKTHAVLTATGNVPEVFHGSAETVLTPGLSNGSISPDSSASQAEFRAVQKENLDLVQQNEKLRRALEKVGLSVDAAEAVDKCTFTDNSVNQDILDQLYPGGFSYHDVEVDGKRKLRLGSGPCY